ncbi:MAG: hypothetical protein H6765_07895 [Candidatus Peribacteria bacterium]|nr:MAG: hypothetical protein H6765_07895 [Candidatus Peribacteria bacterium]
MDGRLLLPNYLYVLPYAYWPGNFSTNEVLISTIESGMLHDELMKQENNEKFDEPLIREVLYEAYPYEVDLKYLQKDIMDDVQRNERLIGLFNDFFRVDYKAQLQKYYNECQRQELFWTSHQIETEHIYDDMGKAVHTFLSYIYNLLRMQ